MLIVRHFYFRDEAEVQEDMRSSRERLGCSSGGAKSCRRMNVKRFIQLDLSGGCKNLMGIVSQFLIKRVVCT